MYFIICHAILWFQFRTNLIPKRLVFVLLLCDSRKYPYPPPTDGQWKFLRGGGLKGKEFSRVLKDANRTRHTYVNYFDLQRKKIRNSCPFEKELRDVCLTRLFLCWQFAIILQTTKQLIKIM